MDYWVSINGEKKGPLKEWDVKELIESEVLTESGLIWHKDQENWSKVGDNPSFKHVFEKLKTPPPLEEDPEEEAGEATPAPPIQVPVTQNHFWVRRGFAKVFDLMLYVGIFFILSNLSGYRFGLDPELQWMEIIKLFPFFFLEAYLLKAFGITPGKWILGLRVVPLDGFPKLNYEKSLFRSGGSWFFGMALGFAPFFIISMIVSYLTAGKRGHTTWDIIGKTKVISSRPVMPSSVASYIISAFALIGSFGYFIQNHKPTADAYYQFSEEHYEEIVKSYPKIAPYLPKKPDQ